MKIAVNICYAFLVPNLFAYLKEWKQSGQQYAVCLDQQTEPTAEKAQLMWSAMFACRLKERLITNLTTVKFYAQSNLIPRVM